MKWNDSEQIRVPFFSFENLDRTGMVVNAFTTRELKAEGTDFVRFQPLLRKDSDPFAVESCRRIMLEQFGIDECHLVPSAQKHTANIHLVTRFDLGPKESRPVLESIDGLVTDIPGVMLQTFGADCPSVYMLDPVHKAIGLCHSGRNGTQRHIAAVMLLAMKNAFGSEPERMICAISPGICGDCYEVGEDVAEIFRQDYETLLSDPSLFPQRISFPCAEKAPILWKSGEKYHIDLFHAIQNSLVFAGVPETNIESSDLCTKCRSDLFYSLRAEGRISNENSALLMLK